MEKDGSLRVAFATDDGAELVKEHFGDAEKFLIYDIDDNSSLLVEERENNSPEERMHGDPKKAGRISDILKDADVLVGFTMGPNIVRMRKRFVPVISPERNIKKSIELLRARLTEVRGELSNEEKKVIML